MCGRYGNLIALEAYKGLIIKREERTPNIGSSLFPCSNHPDAR